MSEKEWERFFSLLEKIAAMGGTWKEKKQEVEAQASHHDAEMWLEEFTNWFQGED